MKAFLLLLSIVALLGQLVCAQTSPETIPNPLKLKKILTKADRVLWRQKLHWSDECEQGVAHYGDQFAGLNFYPIKKDQYIVEVICTLGAYQGSQYFYFIDDSQGRFKSQLLEMEQFAEDEATSSFYKFTDTLVWGTITFDSKQAHLINLNRFRGDGGCGTQTTYDASKIPIKVIKFGARTECTEASIPPTQWKRYSLKQMGQWKISTSPFKD